MRWWHGPILGCDHEWRAPLPTEKFPVCTICGIQCWYMRGYRTGMGTQFGPDYRALALMREDDPRLEGIPWRSIPNAPWSSGKP